mgnify:CR=1 FL=1
MDFKAGVGSLMCRLCGAPFQMPIHHLHEPIDVFTEWLDDCEAAKNGGTATAAAADNDDLPASSGLSRAKPSAKDDARQKSIDLGDEDSDDDE